MRRMFGQKPKLGLTEVPTAELKQLLKSLHRDEVFFPLNAEQLACVGLQHRSENLLGTLRRLDKEGVRAVLVAVLAERSR